MIIPDSKKIVSVILGKMRPDGHESMASMKNEEELDVSDAALKAIAEDLLMAFKNDSAHDLMVALKAFMSELQIADEKQDRQMME